MTLVALPAAVVDIPADRHGRFARHEAFAAACQLALAPLDDPADSATPLTGAPDLAQLWHARALGLIAVDPRPERTRTVLAPRDAIALARDTGAGFYEVQLAADGPRSVAPLSGAAVLRPAIRAAAPAARVRARRPCVVRDGRGRAWPVSRLIRGGVRTAEPVMIDGDTRLIQVHAADGWALIATDDDALPLGWVPAAAVGPEEHDVAP